MIRAWRLWLFVLVLLALGGAVSYAYFRRFEAEKVIQYTTVNVTEGDVTKSVSATGSLEAVTRTSVGSEVSGKIVKLLVDYNSKVHKGQLLAVIDPSTLDSQVEQQRASLIDARASYQNAVANLANTRSGVPKADAAVLSAEANVESARATLDNSRSGIIVAEAAVTKARAQLDYSTTNNTRSEVLLKRDLIAKSDLENARSSYLQDRATLESNKSQVDAAHSTLRSNVAALRARQADLASAVAGRDGAVAQVSAAQATVASQASKVTQAEATLEQSQVQLSKTRISSPIDGIVVARNVTLGQTVQASFTTPDMFELAENLNQMQVEVSVDEADIGQVKKGADCTFTVDAYPDDSFSGTVSEVRLSPTSTSGVITYTVIVKTKNPKLKLMPGMTATVSIAVATAEDALLIPNSALRFQPPAGAFAGGRHHRRGGADGLSTPEPGATPAHHREGGEGGHRRSRGPHVFTLKGGKLVFHRIKLGISDGVNTEVLDSDLKEGDAVVTEATVPGGNATPAAHARGGGGGRHGGPRLF
jgi:HlyD family secretion protein